MPRLRRCNRERDGLEVAHLADEYHVWVLPQYVFQRLGEALCVLVDLALVDDALLMAVEELYRVFDAHDVLISGLVDPVDHGGQGGRFAAPRRPRHQYKTPWLLGQIFDGLAARARPGSLPP